MGTFQNSDGPDEMPQITVLHKGLLQLLRQKQSLEIEHNFIWKL